MATAINQLLTVTRLHLDVDMRKIHTYRRYKRGLRAGQGVLLLNSRRTMYRLIGPTGGFIQDYAPEGETYDVALIQKQIGSLRLRMKLTSQMESNIDDHDQVETRRVA